MRSSDRSSRHAATSRRRAAKERRKDRDRSIASEEQLAKAAEREAKKRDKETKKQKKAHAKQPDPGGWAAPIAAIGIVVVLFVVAAILYKTMISDRPVASTTQSKPVAASTAGVSDDSAKAAADAADSAVSKANGARSLAALAKLTALASALSKPRQPLPGNPELTERLLVVAAGDVMMDRNVSDLIDSDGGKAPLEDVASIMRRGDFTVVNLETPLSERGEARDKDVTFRGNPDGVKALTWAGVDAVSLANNHALDYGDAALGDTLDLLDANKIAHAGAGGNEKEAWEPAIVRTKGKRVAYLAWSYIEPGGFVADSDSAGIAGAKENTEKIAAAIRAAKKFSDFVIVSFHWGVEYEDYPVDEQEELGRAAIDAGADLVASHHPHVIQGIEVYRKKLIAYSLGDFVFDHYSRKTGEGFILEAKLGRKKTLSARVIPTYANEQGKPSVVTGDEADSILDRLKEISSGFGTKMRVENDVATIQLAK